MDDPRTAGLVGPQPKQANHSRLMQRLARAGKGEVVNLCPFGCQDHELDAQGYCDHLVGFTIPLPGSAGEDTKHFEPMKLRKGPMGKVTGRFTDGSDIKPVLPGDKLERITICSRVYREKPEAPVEAKKAG